MRLTDRGRELVDLQLFAGLCHAGNRLRSVSKKAFQKRKCRVACHSLLGPNSRRPGGLPSWRLLKFQGVSLHAPVRNKSKAGPASPTTTHAHSVRSRQTRPRRTGRRRQQRAVFRPNTHNPRCRVGPHHPMPLPPGTYTTPSSTPQTRAGAPCIRAGDAPCVWPLSAPLAPEHTQRLPATEGTKAPPTATARVAGSVGCCGSRPPATAPPRARTCARSTSVSLRLSSASLMRMAALPTPAMYCEKRVGGSEGGGGGVGQYGSVGVTCVDYSVRELECALSTKCLTDPDALRCRAHAPAPIGRLPHATPAPPLYAPAPQSWCPLPHLARRQVVHVGAVLAHPVL